MTIDTEENRWKMMIDHLAECRQCSAAVRNHLKYIEIAEQAMRD